jgi:hypothetical protein
MTSISSSTRSIVTSARAAVILVTVTALLLGVGVAPTLAAAPEAPETGEATGVSAFAATLHGVLDPKAASAEVVVEYEFFYAPRGALCTQGGVAPESVGMATGAKGEAVSASLDGLEPSTQYAFCLAVRNTGEESWTVGPPQKFTTLAVPSAVLSESASDVKPTEARLEGVVNPDNQLTECHFQYGLASKVVTEHEVSCEPESLKGFGEDDVSVSLRELEPEKTYKYRIVANNGKDEKTIGAEKEFKKLVAPPEAPTTEGAEEITNAAAELHGVVNPAGSSTVSWFFEYAAGSSCAGADARATPAQGPEEVQGRAAEAKITHLEPGTKYTFCLVVENEAKEKTTGNQVSFAATALVPVVAEEEFSQAEATGVTLSAEVNTGGLEAEYRVQYGTTDAYGMETPASTLAADANKATTRLAGLQPSTEYHYRIVITDRDGSESGTDATFITLPSGIQGLPDGRVYEMVTPVNREDAELYVPEYGSINNESEGVSTQRLMEAAEDGNAVVYQGEATHDGAAESSGDGQGSAYLATRMPNGGWTQVSIQPPGRRETAYHGFSGDLSIGVLSSRIEDPLYEEEQLPGGSLPTKNSEFFDNDLYKHALGAEDYEPLVTTPVARSTAELSKGPSDDNNSVNGRAAPLYAGGSLGLSQVLFESTEAALSGGGSLESELDEDVKREIANKQHDSYYLYDRSESGPSLIDVSPGGSVIPNATFGAPAQIGVESISNPPDFSHVISRDGSRIFWTALEGTNLPEESSKAMPKALYVRENATQPQSPLNGQGECTVSTDACTIQMDKEVGGGGRFWTASGDGSKAFFTKGSLYEYEVNPISGREGLLKDITPGVEVQGVIGASEDGSYVYYVNSADELYALHQSGSEWEAPVLIATLSSADGNEIEPFDDVGGYRDEAGDWVPNIGRRTAEVTPDGQGLVFMSNQNLKVQGFPNGYQSHGSDNVYVYNAATKGLYCASCSQSGEPGLGGFLPVSWSNSYIPTVISEGGNRVFFNSDAPLVSRDTNGAIDVYEWEREGTGTCAQGEGANGACIYLMSGGSGNENSWLLGASASGNDVFVITTADLTPEAPAELFKIFDARVDGVEPVSPPACSGTGCQGVPDAPPTFATPSSATFSGVGNFSPAVPSSRAVKAKTKPKSTTRAQKLSRALRACKKRPSQRRASCDARAKKRYGTKQRSRRSSGSTKGRK